jgi:alpha-L-rhamnosidase
MPRFLPFFLASIFFSLCFSSISAQKLTALNLTCEYKTNPIDIDVKFPRLSWKMQSSGKGILQVAYKIRVSTNPKDFSSKHTVWESEKIVSDQSVYVPFAGKELSSGTRYYWQVRVWDNKGNISSWSEVNFWEMGLLNKSDWHAKWIIEGQNQNKGNNVSPMFRKEFNLDKKIKKARLYITAHGLYEAEINGKRVGEDYFTPGWTSYHKRLQYQIYDITTILQPGDNAIGITLGKGWFAGILAGGIKYGDRLALLSQIEIEYENGQLERILSDDSWKTTTDGPILISELYDGEKYDARKEIKEWSFPGFNDQGLKNAQVDSNLAFNNLVTSVAAPVKQHEILKPVNVILTPNGEKVIDFGQNLVGWVRIKINGKGGDSIIISHAEVLDKAGNFYTENLRAAKQKIVYYLRGNGEETYQPHFTFQGFRYVKIEGALDNISKDNIEAVAIYSAMKPTGFFNTSNNLLNQLQHNIQWGQKGNFLDVPTDCPQRDERLGWTGDAQVFFKTAAYNMNVSGFFAKWLLDLKADQQDDGSVPQIVPNIWGKSERSAGSAGWADAATIVPWDFYNVYGDKAILLNQYNSMKAWVNFIDSRSTNNLWNKSWHHGDWLYFMPKDVWDYDPALTDKTLIAQAFYANSIQIVINAAQILGEEKDVQLYSSLLKRVKEVFVKEFMSESGALISNTQTAYVLALHFNLLPENYRKQAAERLVANITEYENHLSTGFLGTPYLCHVLTRFGHNDLAYKILMQESYPSWLYPVKMGATTIWERWDGIRTDGTFQSKEMNSFNHYAYGAIGDWMYRNITGINQREGVAGYKEFDIAPKIGGGLTFAKAELETIYGKIVSSWNLTGEFMTMNIEVPVNTIAHVNFPNVGAESIKESGKVIQLPLEMPILTIGSGKYEFKYRVK